MYRRIYSKVNPSLLCHIVYQPEWKKNEDYSDIVRTNISDAEEFLQSAHIYIPKEGHKFRPHIHNELIRQTNITQESWVVLSGLIRVTFYDIDGEILEESLLHPTWMSITFRGGHTYESMRDDTNVLEFKTGPYLGQEKDKEFIKE